jgi:hypothetical protein
MTALGDRVGPKTGRRTGTDVESDMMCEGGVLMRATVVIAVIVTAAFALPSSAGAQEFPQQPPPAFAPVKPPQPFGNLFGRERPIKPRKAVPFNALAARALERAPSPAIACPMRTLPADPAFDATIRHAPPLRNGPAFTIRIAPPLACQP